MLSTAITAAKKAGDFLKTSFTTDHTLSYKDALNVVTEADIAAEKIILGVLQTSFPDHSFFSEEAGLIDNGSEYLWIIDPLDGTTNFSRQFPYFGVSIGLTYKHQPLLGVVAKPLTGDIINAQVGKGAFLNGQKIKVNNESALGKSVVLLGRGNSPEGNKRFGVMYAVLQPHIRTFRAYGSIAMDGSAVAQGLFEAVVMNGANFYDCAAVATICIEARALVTDFKGNPWSSVPPKSDIIIANPTLNASLVSLLSSL